MRYCLLLLTAGLVACQTDTSEPATSAAEAPADTEMTEEVAAPSALAALLDAQPDEIKARYASRNPKETLEFFGIQPGMTVLEGLPGRGWYTRMLLQYLGSEGT
ncbi:MAG: methyltransferase, partial [Pseudomonadota bacterium]